MTPAENRTLQRERAIYRYVSAFDRGDWEALAKVVAEAEADPELDHLLIEVNAALYAETGLQEADDQVDLVRQLARDHLLSAFEDDASDAGPLTVGDVAAHLQANHAAGWLLPTRDLAINERLRLDRTELPTSITSRAIAQLATRLGVLASPRYWEQFRRAALILTISRERSRVELAAARRQRGARGAEGGAEQHSEVKEES